MFNNKIIPRHKKKSRESVGREADEILSRIERHIEDKSNITDYSNSFNYNLHTKVADVKPSKYNCNDNLTNLHTAGSVNLKSSYNLHLNDPNGSEKTCP